MSRHGPVDPGKEALVKGKRKSPGGFHRPAKKQWVRAPQVRRPEGGGPWLPQGMVLESQDMIDVCLACTMEPDCREGAPGCEWARLRRERRRRALAAVT